MLSLLLLNQSETVSSDSSRKCTGLLSDKLFIERHIILDICIRYTSHLLNPGSFFISFTSGSGLCNGKGHHWESGDLVPVAHGVDFMTLGHHLFGLSFSSAIK